ncbi:MAG TPA: response regulator [Terriglobia bacterium]|nr:response regulator [Terriglobia bacterium]
MNEVAQAVRRVLLAEDNAVNRQIVVELLQMRGHYVKLATNGLEVLQALDHESFDVILMDAQMPEMDGFQTTAAIRNREKESDGHVTIIALTGLAAESDRKRCIDAGMDGYLGKPIRSKELFEVVEGV